MGAIKINSKDFLLKLRFKKTQFERNLFTNLVNIYQTDRASEKITKFYQSLTDADIS